MGRLKDDLEYKAAKISDDAWMAMTLAELKEEERKYTYTADELHKYKMEESAYLQRLAGLDQSLSLAEVKIRPGTVQIMLFKWLVAVPSVAVWFFRSIAGKNDAVLPGCL